MLKIGRTWTNWSELSNCLTNCRCTGQPRWTGVSGCPPASAPSRWRSDSPARPPEVVFYFFIFSKTFIALVLFYLVLPARPRRVGNAGAKALGKLSHKVVVDSVFHRAQDYHRSARSKCSHVSRHELGGWNTKPGELDINLLDRFIRKKYEKYDIWCTRNTKPDESPRQINKWEIWNMRNTKPGELEINLLDRFISENMRLTPLLPTPVLADFNFSNGWKIEWNLGGSTSQRRSSAHFFLVEVSEPQTVGI